MDQIAINSRALMSAADRLSRAGYDGDSYAFVEGLIMSALADGYRQIEKPPPMQGPCSTPAARAAALAEAERAVSEAKTRRTGGEK